MARKQASVHIFSEGLILHVFQDSSVRPEGVQAGIG
jgi:hypothetical protein